MWFPFMTNLIRSNRHLPNILHVCVCIMIKTQPGCFIFLRQQFVHLIFNFDFKDAVQYIGLKLTM